jgi:hypothetical protein
MVPEVKAEKLDKKEENDSCEFKFPYRWREY